MRIRVRVVAALALLVPLGPVLAGDPAAGEAAAGTCVACHGEAGAKPISNYPIIAGQHENYLLLSMIGYRDGERDNAVMLQQLAGQTDAELANLAAYFAAQEGPLK